MESNEEPTLHELAARLLAWVQYHRAMGQDELFRKPDEVCRYVAPPRASEHPEVPVVAATALPPTGGETDEPLPPRAALDQLDASLQDCQRCPLHRERKKVVFGTGAAEADLAFVGEGPGRDEDIQGEPFVGAAGQLLDRIIRAIGLERDQVYICNVVKCRPPGNRTPEPVEQETCGPFLKRQLELVQPKVIVALGATAARFLLQTERPVRQLRGRFHQFPLGSAVVMPTYHPAYLLRSPQAKRDVWEDMKQVRDRLGLKA